MAAVLTAAGLDTELTYDGYDLAIPKDRYLGMVRNRYMSLLSSFTAEELEDGIAEISQRYPGPNLEFTDGFAFIQASKSRRQTSRQPQPGRHEDPNRPRLGSRIPIGP